MRQRPFDWSSPPCSARRAAIALLAVSILGFASAGCGGPPVKKPADLKTSMVFVPAGEFIMGRDDGDKDEQPQRRVWLDAFYIDRTEATTAQFKAFCDATGYLYPNNPEGDANYFLGHPQWPVVNITWDQAAAYCKSSGKRLPTEAEWEKAARGTDGRKYPWGNDWADSTGNFFGTDSFRRASPVGSFPAGASPYGALDMAGNVWEWCGDWYLLNAYASAPARNPPGPPGPTPWRVARGGSFTSPKSDAEVANRSKAPPTQVLHHLGCRCVWSPH